MKLRCMWHISLLLCGHVWSGRFLGRRSSRLFWHSCFLSLFLINSQLLCGIHEPSGRPKWRKKSSQRVVRSNNDQLEQTVRGVLSVEVHRMCRRINKNWLSDDSKEGKRGLVNEHLAKEYDEVIGYYTTAGHAKRVLTSSWDVDVWRTRLNYTYFQTTIYLITKHKLGDNSKI